MEMLKILMLEDDENDMELIKLEITSSLKFDFRFKWVVSRSDFEQALIDFYPDIVLSDFKLPQLNGLEAARMAREMHPDTPIIIVTGTISEEAAADSIKAGAWDYVVKERLHRLPIAIEGVLKLKNERLKLKASEEKFRLITTYAQDGIIMIDNEGKINYWNPGAEKIFGYSIEEARNKNIHSLLAPSKYHSQHLPAFQHFRETGEGPMLGKVVELEALKKDGTIIDIELSLAGMQLSEGYGAVGIVRDISERKKAENEIKRQYYFIDAMLHSIPVPLFYKDTEGKYLGCNEAFSEMFGKSAEEIRGKTVNELWPEQYSQTYNEKDMELLRDKSRQRYESVILDKDQKEYQVIYDKAVFYNEKDEVAGIIGTFTNITELKKKEAELILAKEKAEESDRLKSAFLAAMSHELRTPLNAVIGFSSLIDDSLPLDEILEMAKLINKSGNHLLSIIESIFNISMLQTKELKIRPESFSVYDVFLELKSFVEAEINNEKKEHISVLFEPEPNTTSTAILTDKTKLIQMLTNLLNNAVKFTEKGKIEFGYFFSEKDITFFVQDTGIGIPSDKTDLIFERFRQVDDTHTRKHGGIGLGLAICKEISDLLGGSLWVDSEEGKGSSFYFQLPGVVDINATPLNENTIETGLPNLKNTTILIAEDIESNYYLIEAMLKKTKAQLLWAKDGDEAVRIVVSEPKIDIVLMDIRMPGMNGYEATSAIKKIQPALKIIAQTAYAMPDEIEKCKQAGCDGYISKPIVKTEFYDLLNKML
ncbi:MAG: PAS domain S-box protein [Lentimicrobiaceae bacterium]|nr:PAS domain S-box protein [Lentimicrobiaceae bacterium]